MEFNTNDARLSRYLLGAKGEARLASHYIIGDFHWLQAKTSGRHRNPVWPSRAGCEPPTKCVLILLQLIQSSENYRILTNPDGLVIIYMGYIECSWNVL